jgi:type III secretion system YscQ/HrcQ family protein
MRALGLRPFSLEGVPHLPSAAPLWTRAAGRVRAAFPHELAVGLGALGLARVRPRRLGFLSGPDSGESFALEVRGCRGRLVVDGALALKLVGALLGAPPAALLRPLGRAERGALAAMAIAVIDGAGLGGAVRLALEPAPPLPGDALCIELGVRSAAGDGLVRVELPAASLPAAPPPAPVDPTAVAPLVTVELARTTLERGALVAAAPGDGVVFDGTAPVAATAPWPVEVRFGACALPASFHPDGSLRRRGPIHTDESEVAMSSESHLDSETRPPMSPEAARALAAAPVEIVAELGRLTVRGDELVGLIEGGVLSLGPRRPTSVQLRVAGRLWAMGELVAVDDELAVRITELVR